MCRTFNSVFGFTMKGNNSTIAEKERHLSRKLTDFNLVLNPVPKDGDCTLKSIIKSRNNTYKIEDKELCLHLKKTGHLTSNW